GNLARTLGCLRPDEDVRVCRRACPGDGQPLAGWIPGQPMLPIGIQRTIRQSVYRALGLLAEVAYPNLRIAVAVEGIREALTGRIEGGLVNLDIGFDDIRELSI